MKRLTIKSKSIQQMIACSLVTLSLVGCDSIPFINNEPDYKGAGRSKPLEVPPDLTASPVSSAYEIPGGTTYSSYSDSQQSQAAAELKLLAEPENVHMEKSGGLRWLVVKAPAEKVWPVIRDFWNDQGFAIRSEDPQIGVMETEWIRADAIKNDKTGGYGDRFDRWLDGLSGITDKRKFKTRIERGDEPETTEIFMTHRSVNGAPDDGKNRVQTQLGEIDTGYRADAGKNKGVKQTALDEELDAELLRRLMVKFGIEEQRSKAIVENAQVPNRAEVVKGQDGSATIKVIDTFDRAWRRVGLAIDRVGFVIEDKDRSNGIFFVRYADVDVDYGDEKKKKGLLETLKFWRDDEEETVPEAKKQDESMVEKLKFWGKKDENAKQEGQYRIKVGAGSDTYSVVNVVDEQGNIVKTRTANRVIGLVFEQLK
jgi:outer membrane protein assembly factor BamC